MGNSLPKILEGVKQIFCVLFAFIFSSQVLAQSREDFTVQLGDFRSKGQIAYPENAKNPVPAVLLIHGSTPMDMDATVQFGAVKNSSIFAQIAEALPQKGIAVVRYNKRYVEAAGVFDAGKFYQLRLQDFLADARAVLRLMRANPRFDQKRIFVYGWSEGSPIAAQLTLEDSSLRGLIVQGVVAYSFARTFAEQFPRVGLPYLRQFAKDGKLDLSAIQAALAGNGGGLARSQALYLLDPTTAQPRLNPYMDTNKDGLIDLEREAVPVMAYFFQDSPNFLGFYSSALALPGLLELAPKIKTPTLILHGENDANTSCDGARELAKALPSATFKAYAGLGHSLGAAKSILDDDFRPMEAAPLEDLVAWVLQQ